MKERKKCFWIIFHFEEREFFFLPAEWRKAYKSFLECFTRDVENVLVLNFAHFFADDKKNIPLVKFFFFLKRSPHIFTRVASWRVGLFFSPLLKKSSTHFFGVGSINFAFSFSFYVTRESKKSFIKKLLSLSRFIIFLFIYFFFRGLHKILMSKISYSIWSR